MLANISNYCTRQSLYYYSVDYIYDYCISKNYTNLLYDSFFWREWLEYHYPSVKETYDGSYNSYLKRIELLPIMESLCDKHYYIPLLELLRRERNSSVLCVPHSIHQKVISGKVYSTFTLTLLSDTYSYHVFGEDLSKKEELDADSFTLVTPEVLSSASIYDEAGVKTLEKSVLDILESLSCDGNDTTVVSSDFMRILLRSKYYDAIPRKCIVLSLSTDLPFRKVVKLVSSPRKKEVTKHHLDILFGVLWIIRDNCLELLRELNRRYPEYLNTSTFLSFLAKSNNKTSLYVVKEIVLLYLTETIGGVIDSNEEEREKVLGYVRERWSVNV